MLMALIHMRVPKKAAVNDVVNLRHGRDFLAEAETYDGVVVHSVYHTSAPGAQEYSIGLGHSSKRHSVDEWRSRLVATGAKVLVVFETQPLSLSGWQLGKLPGYKVRVLEVGLAVYEKEQS
jgi:hypothetical protein